MKAIGIILLIIGIVLGFYALSMDTSVEVNYDRYEKMYHDSYNNSNPFHPERVNNLGLMADRQNYLILSGILSIIGVILIVTDKTEKKTPVPMTQTDRLLILLALIFILIVVRFMGC